MINFCSLPTGSKANTCSNKLSFSFLHLLYKQASGIQWSRRSGGLVFRRAVITNSHPSLPPHLGLGSPPAPGGSAPPHSRRTGACGASVERPEPSAAQANSAAPAASLPSAGAAFLGGRSSPPGGRRAGSAPAPLPEPLSGSRSAPRAPLPPPRAPPPRPPRAPGPCCGVGSPGSPGSERGAGARRRFPRSPGAERGRSGAVLFRGALRRHLRRAGR